MNILRTLIVPLLLAIPAAALADHDRKHSYKEEYWDGHCKVKVEVKKNGDYKEERKCERPTQVYASPAPVQVVVPSPAVVIQPPAIRVQIGR